MERSAMGKYILLLVLGLCIGFACTDGEIQTNEQTETNVEGESIPLIYHMSFISRYTKKLYFSGEAENWELADIYNHEIEEISEGIIEDNIVHDEVNISELMESMLLPKIERVEEAIDNQDREMFRERYNILIQSCNQCHKATNYEAVQVTVPESNPFNQEF